MEDVIVTQDEVKKLLQKLKTDKAQGSDEMHSFFLKEKAEELVLPLSIIFTKSLESFQVPEGWKRGRITALFKKGSKILVSIYCPVSLTSIVCKCMEK